MLLLSWDESENATMIVQESSSYEIELLVVEEEKSTYGNHWLLDSACSNYVCCKKKWFDINDAYGDEVVKLGNGDYLEIVGNDTVKIKMHNGCVRTLSDLRYVPTLERNLISLDRLEALAYGYSASDGVMQVYRGSLRW